jgi:hypothetical integral membrane protein (TIGR02206 family)
LKQFSTPHLAALAILAVVGGTTVWGARRHPGRWLGGLCWLLALAILAGWAGEYAADGVDGTWNARHTLPFQLTDAVSAAAILALLTRRQLLVELTYFWSLTASLQAIVTPDLGQNFPSGHYFSYFAYHIGAVVAGCLLVFGCRIYPRRLAALWAFAATLCFAAIAGVADLITGGNYMYLRTKPEHNSLLNVMGPWPWYVVSGAVLAFGMLLVLALLAEAVRSADRNGDRVASPPVGSGSYL